MDFGNRFFGDLWGHLEWQKFHHFMMRCVQEYLKHGLIKVASINLGKAKLEDKTCIEFVEFADEFVEFGNWQDKREFEDVFRGLYPKYSELSSHIIRKWLDIYSTHKGIGLELKSSASNYFFRIRKEGQDA